MTKICENFIENPPEEDIETEMGGLELLLPKGSNIPKVAFNHRIELAIMGLIANCNRINAFCSGEERMGYKVKHAGISGTAVILSSGSEARKTSESYVLYDLTLYEMK